MDVSTSLGARRSWNDFCKLMLTSLSFVAYPALSFQIFDMLA